MCNVNIDELEELANPPASEDDDEMETPTMSHVLASDDEIKDPKTPTMSHEDPNMSNEDPNYEL